MRGHTGLWKNSHSQPAQVKKNAAAGVDECGMDRSRCVERVRGATIATDAIDNTL